MLVLSRKRNEKIIVGENITVTVVAIRGDKVRLGFTAPDDVPVHREEVHREIKARGGPASQSKSKFKKSA